MATGKSLPAIPDLAGAAPAATIVTTVNLLLKELRDRGWMDK